MQVNTCNQEIIENIADRAHFHFVHDTVDVPETTFRMDGPTLRGRQETRMQTPRGKVDGAIDSTYWGLGFGTTRFTGICEALMALGLTPVGEEQLDLCNSFFRKDGGDPWADIEWSAKATGAPVVHGCLAWIDCDVDAIHEGGDHWIVLGAVKDMGVAEDAAGPLLFYQGGYGAFHGFGS